MFLSRRTSFLFLEEHTFHRIRDTACRRGSKFFRASPRLGAIDAMSFHRPVTIGDVVCCYAEIKRVGKTSLTVGIEAWVIHRVNESRMLGLRSRGVADRITCAVAALPSMSRACGAARCSAPLREPYYPPRDRRQYCRYRRQYCPGSRSGQCGPLRLFCDYG